MRRKGKGRKAVCHSPIIEHESFLYGSQDDDVSDESLHCVLETSRKIHVNVDFRNQFKKKQSSYAKVVPLGDGDLKENEMDIDRDNNEETSASKMRDKVKKILALYRDELHKLTRENEKSGGRTPNIHQEAASLLHGRGVYFLNQDKQIGDVPGIEIGDEFESRVELYITGLHLQFNKGIDFIKEDGTLLAISIVESRRYPNTVHPCGDLIYVGEGGNPNVGSHCRVKDQKMEGGNLALMNSKIQSSPVRVIRKDSFQKPPCYFYDGLYLVVKHWKETGPFYKYIYKFQLRRLSKQPSPRGFPCKSIEYLRDVINKDLSRGKEKFPIVVINKINDQKLEKFTYISKPVLPKDCLCGGCDCEGGCSDSEHCSCKVKNGGNLVYDYDQCITTKSSLIFECGPYCKCFESCLNKVSQRGIQVELEVFKVDTNWWGVRSRKKIAKGSFVCEYIGEILRLKVGDLDVIGDNDYLFIVGYDNKDCGEVLAIDARQQGNVGRYIRRSCLPNLSVRKAYVSPDVKTPHILLFASKDIGPLEELTYDYKWWLG